MSSFHPVALTAQQQVLETDMDLLREVLAGLGTDIRDCIAALLVSRFWCAALDSTNPWNHLLRRHFPSMAAPGAFLGHPQQEHQLFHRSAKELLCLRISDANPATREKREVRRLEEEFRNEHVMINLRHRYYGVIAEAEIPIIRGKDYSSNFLYTSHPLPVNLVLSPSDYASCKIVLQMPGGLELMVNGDLDAEHVIVGEVEEHVEIAGASETGATTTKTLLRWDFKAHDFDLFDEKCTGFSQFRSFEEREFFHFNFSITCAYTSSLEMQPKTEAECRALFKNLPISVTEAAIDVSATLSSAGPLSLYDSLSSFAYLKFMESWMVVARHLRDDAIEFTRLRCRLAETYLLVEVGLTREESIGGGVTTGVRSDVTDTPMDNAVGFALVSLVDQEALFNLSATQSTSVQFLTRNGHHERLPPADYRVVRVSMLDLGLNRVMKLGEGYFLSESYEDEDPFGCYNSTSNRHFYCLDRIIQLMASFEEDANASEVEGDNRATNIMLSVYVYPDEKDEDDDRSQHFGSVLEIWKFLEICMTGETS